MSTPYSCGFSGGGGIGGRSVEAWGSEAWGSDACGSDGGGDAGEVCGGEGTGVSSPAAGAMMDAMSAAVMGSGLASAGHEPPAAVLTAAICFSTEPVMSFIF